VFNIFLILALISLVIAGAFLLSDIMSYKSNTAQNGAYSALSLKTHQESQATVKNWQEKGINLIAQLKSVLGMKGPAKVAGKDAAVRDKARALLAKNRLAKAKVARTKTENLSRQENPMSPSNSSRTRTLDHPLKATSAIMIGSAESEGSTDSSIHNGEDSSSSDIENNQPVVTVPFTISENQPDTIKSVSDESVSIESGSNESTSNESILKNSDPNEPAMNDSLLIEQDMNESILIKSVSNYSILNNSVTNEPILSNSVTNKSIFRKENMNESLLNESKMNEPVVTKSAINKSVLNESMVNESQMHMNSSINTSRSMLATDNGSNGTRNNTHPFVPRSTNLTSDNLSPGSVALVRSQMNIATMNSTEIHGGIAQDRNSSAASSLIGFNNTNEEIGNQNKTSDLKANNDSAQDKKAKNESQGALPDQKNTTSDALASSRNNNISASGVPDKTSNITSDQITRSLEGHLNSEPAGKTSVANNSISQFQEPKQNQTYNQDETSPRSNGSSIPLPSLPDNKTKGLQNNAVKNKNAEKKVSSSSGSAKSQESKKGPARSVNKFRTLKLPTPSWITKAESKNKKKAS